MCKVTDPVFPITMYSRAKKLFMPGTMIGPTSESYQHGSEKEKQLLPWEDVLCTAGLFSGE